MSRVTLLRLGLYARFCEVHDQLLGIWDKTQEWNEKLEDQCQSVLDEINDTFEEPTVETMAIGQIDLIFNKPYVD